MAKQFTKIDELIQDLKSFQKQKTKIADAEFRAYIEENCFEQLGVGSFRMAFKIDFADETSVVLKISRKRGGIASIKKEVNIWKKIEEDDKRLFANVITYDSSHFRWIIMEYLDKLDWSLWDNNSKTRKLIYKIDRKYDIGDLDGRNIGARKEDRKFPVIYDWGGYQN